MFKLFIDTKNECKINECHNHNICVYSLLYEILCLCSNDYYGKKCEKSINNSVNLFLKKKNDIKLVIEIYNNKCTNGGKYMIERSNR